MRECRFISEQIRTTDMSINAINTRMETPEGRNERERGKGFEFCTRGVVDLRQLPKEKPDVFLI